MSLDTSDATAAENWLAAIVEFSDDAIISKTLEGRISTWNAAAERLFGYTGLEAMGQSIAMLIPEGRQDEMPRILDLIRRGERVEAYETQRRHKDGRIIDILLRVSPIRDGSGQVVGASKIARDISERRIAERRQRQLKDELNHRVKNTLATVQSIASQTFRSSPEPAAFRNAFEARLIALSSAHDLLEARQWEAVELRDIIACNLAPFADRARVDMAGPRVLLGQEATVSFGIAFNELAVNAVRSGALSGATGRLTVKWQTLDPGDGRGACLRIDWIECLEERLVPPTRTGFGRRFLEVALARQIDGRVTLTFGSHGLCCQMDCRLAALQDRARDGVGPLEWTG